MADYPHVDFTHLVHEDDVLWDKFEGKKESLLEQSERIYTFLTEFVAQRPEEEIAIVSHSAYLFTMLNAVVDTQDDDLKSWFLTSEVRTIRLQFADNLHFLGPVE
ncbi:Histidine phosphatase [Fragilaria crotonensis]|nr:Histidine phosphatase [Fragilaria crotonensis]